MKPFPLSKVYQLLEPRIVSLTTVRRGNANVMTVSGHMMVEFEPPQGGNYSFAKLRAAREFVIAIPANHLAPLVVNIGN
jgi:flavin reductase (DIM6/NTAB) family NADH-FMN oxidoreductase RutF